LNFPLSWPARLMRLRGLLWSDYSGAKNAVKHSIKRGLTVVKG
jgi:hypothetical protein